MSSVRALEAQLAAAHNPAEAARLRERIAERRYHNARRRDIGKARAAAPATHQENPS